jgi:hypothetical protein
MHTSHREIVSIQYTVRYLSTVFLTYVKNMLNYGTLAQQLGLMEWLANLILLP